MEVLWLAIFMYSIGLGVVLHFRPALMFHANGSWKEFGYQRDSRHTLFPFWLFAVSWAFVSYAVAAATIAIAGESGAAATATAAATTWLSARPEEEEEEVEPDEEPEPEFTVPISRARTNRKTTPRASSKPRAGYYMLDPEQNTTSGLRRYIYYGSSPPAEA
jgi:hypothetical protein